jgi:hypothetical protein
VRKTKRKKLQKMPSREYVEGRDAQKAFENVMKALFRVPKAGSRKIPRGKN